MPEYHSGRTYSNSSGYHEPPITPMTKEQHQKLLDTFSKRVARSKAKDKTTEVEHESLENKSVEHSAPVKEQQSLYSYAPPELEPQNQSVSLVERGEQAYQQKDYATAYDIYSEVVKLEPNNYKAWFQLSVSANQSDNHIVAIEASQKLIDSGKYTAQATYFQGVSLEKVGRKKEAAIAYQKAGAEIPESKSAFFRLEEERLFGGFNKETLNVSELSQVDKLSQAVTRSAKYFPGEIAEELKAIFSPANLGIMLGVFAVYAAASFTGFSQGLTFAMAMAGVLFFGMDVVAIFRDLAGFAGAINANTEEELDEAGQHLASLVAKIGVDALMTLLTGKIAQEIGKSVDNLNQVDEVHAHNDPDVNAGNSDNAEGVNAGQVNEVDNANKQTPNIKDHDGVQDKQNIMERIDEIAPRSDDIIKEAIESGNIPARAQNRINIRAGSATLPRRYNGSGLNYAFSNHLNPAQAGRKSQFSISRNEIMSILMDEGVIKSPVEVANAGATSRTGGLGFIREVDLSTFGYQTIGNLPQNDIFNGQPTSKITIITDGFGNLKNVFPGFLNDLNRGR